MFKKLSLSDSKKILNAVNEKSDLSDFDPANSVAMAQTLSFYPEYKMIELSDKSIIPEKQLHVIYKSPDDFVIIDYTNAPIYDLNKNCPIYLDSGVVNDYVRFFFQFVRGPHGRFIITESLDDITWQDEPPLNARKAISKLLTPVTLKEHKNGSYALTVTYIFLDSLVKSTIHVDKKGFITVEDEEILIEDMPVIHEDFGA